MFKKRQVLSIFLIVFVSFFITLTASFAGVYMTVTGPGVCSNNEIIPNQQVNFNIFYHNNFQNQIHGTANGFVLYSQDGATWTSPYVDTLPIYTSLFNTNIIHWLSVDGQYADTIGFINIVNQLDPDPGEGMFPGYDTIVAIISTTFDNSSVGTTFCVDSTSFLSEGDWNWSNSMGTLVIPSWSGQRCFTIVPDTTIPDTMGYTEVSITAEGAIGAVPTNSGEITFNIHYTNVSGFDLQGFTNGFKVYSTDGAVWSPLVADTVPGIGNYFDYGVFINEFSNDGFGEDTIGLGGVKMYSDGFPTQNNEILFTIKTTVDSAQDGKTICIDSVFYPPTGSWLWSFGPDGDTNPNWSGPYCYTINTGTDPQVDASISMYMTGPGAGTFDTSGFVFAGLPVTFNVATVNNLGANIPGFTNGFVLQSDSATWSQPVLEYNSFLDTLFDFGYFLNEFSVDGHLADTFGVGGIAIYGTGFYNGFNADIVSITTTFSEQSIGSMVCFDSAFYPPTGYWLWSYSGGNAITPNWNGPYCFMVMPSDSGQLAHDSLIIESNTFSPCDNDCISVAVKAKLTQPIKGATVPIQIPYGVEICSVSNTGLITEDWNLEYNINYQEGYVLVGLFNLVGDILEGEPTLFNLEFKTTPLCDSTNWIYWDTTLSNDQSRRLLFSSAQNLPVHPGFNKYRDASTILGYLPGDINGDGERNITDLTCLIDYLFNESNCICNLGAANMNGDCYGPDISDLTFFVDYLFLNGSTPMCSYTWTGNSLAPKLSSDLSIGYLCESGKTTIYLNSPVDLRGVQLTLNSQTEINLNNLAGENFDILHGIKNNSLQIGLTDLNNPSLLKSGSYPILELDGNVEIVSAVVSDSRHKSLTPEIIAGKGTSIPVSFMLYQNYPNPFNPTTEIRFDIPKSGDVTLDIYNIIGQKVVTIADGYFEAGTYTHEWDASPYSSGIYLYNLRIDDYTMSKKMILLK